MSRFAFNELVCGKSVHESYSRRMAILPQKKTVFFPLLCIAMLFAVQVKRLSGRDNFILSETIVGKDILEAETQAVEWLKGQIIPNDIVPEPDPTRRRLVLSYMVPTDDPAYPYIYSRSFIYDNVGLCKAL